MGALTAARTPTRSRRRPSARRLALVVALAVAAAGCIEPPPADPGPTTATSASVPSPVPSPAPSPWPAPSPSPAPWPAPSPSPGSILDNLEAGPPDALPLPFPTAALAEVADGEVDPEVRAAIQAAHDAFQERGGNRGADVLTVIRAEEGTWTSVVGTADGTTPVTPEHQFSIGTLGRLVHFAEVMSLVEDGLLDLEREVTHYLPKSLGFDTDATVRDLLHHTSGLPDHHLALRATIEADPGHRFTPAELLDAVPDERGAAGSPGSSTDDVLLGLAIEHVTGLSVAQAFRTHVLTGTGLEGLAVQPEERPQGPVALPARPDAARRFDDGGGYLPSLAAASAGWPASGMASTTQALARFMQLLCGGHILSTAALSEFAAWADDPSGGAAGTPVLGLVNVDAGYAGMALCLPLTGRAVAIVSSAAEVAATVPVVPLMDTAVQP